MSANTTTPLQDPSTMTYFDLDRAFAREYLGWVEMTWLGGILSPSNITWQLKDKSEFKGTPQFSQEANLVMPSLAQHSCEIHHMHREKIGWQWEAAVWPLNGSFFPEEGSSETFAHAAVIALVMAARKAKGQS